MAHQLSLLDMRPVCPVCKRSVSILGQYDPYHYAMICRDCTLEMALPVDLWQPHPRKPGELQIDRDPALSAIREKRIIYGERIRDAVRKRPPCPPRRAMYMRWLREAQCQPIQFELPVCPTCGKPCSTSESGFAVNCMICKAKGEIEAAWRFRRVTLAGDMEDQLDKLYRVFPKWFDLGLMPDYWFELAHRGGQDAS